MSSEDSISTLGNASRRPGLQFAPSAEPGDDFQRCGAVGGSVLEHVDAVQYTVAPVVDGKHRRADLVDFP
ncbi:MAG: hypothetical protein GY820_05915 [Gammaproteobacteria bacterium]|nr:hypothetical protein [Gammaproteobacteria bacterium]